MSTNNFIESFRSIGQDGELPWSDIDQLSRDEAILRVRKIFAKNFGFPRTFLAIMFTMIYQWHILEILIDTFGLTKRIAGTMPTHGFHIVGDPLGRAVGGQ